MIDPATCPKLRHTTVGVQVKVYHDFNGRASPHIEIWRGTASLHRENSRDRNPQPLLSSDQIMDARPDIRGDMGVYHTHPVGFF
jgi:hypothetical protein